MIRVGFLEKYSKLIQLEVMDHCKEIKENIPEQWISNLVAFSDKELYLLESFSFQNVSFLGDFYLNCKKYGLWKNFNKNSHSLDKKQKWKLRNKKIHEIERILSYLKIQKVKDGLIWDIGGGVGHFANILSSELNRHVNSVDINQNFQKIGKKKYIDNKLLDFIHKDFNTLESKVHKSDSLFGLHACGNLTSNIIKFCVKEKLQNYFGFGCCYYKGEDYRPLTKYGLAFSSSALTLACRPHYYISKKNFYHRLSVKRYRYTFFLFLKKYAPSYSKVGLGNANPQSYWKDFSSYSKDQLKTLGLNSFTDFPFQTFYHSVEVNQKVQEMIVLGVLRGLLGRPIELVVNLDRSLFLEENYYKVQMLELFNGELSPRNILIYATRETH